jgi:hypothetical protein
VNDPRHRCVTVPGWVAGLLLALYTVALVLAVIIACGRCP